MILGLGDSFKPAQLQFQFDSFKPLSGGEEMKKKMPVLLTSIMLLAILVSPPTLSAAPYYQGKIITLIVGSEAGGGHDRVARFIAKHLPKHIPGKPTVIVQNMPGASNMVAANHLYHVAKPDGLSILHTHRGLVFMQLLKVKGIEYDIRKFSFIGSAAAESNVFFIRSDLPYKTFDDLRKAKKEIFVGGGGPGSINSQMTNLSKDYLGLNFKLVEYRGTSEIWLAIEQKELDGMHNTYNSSKPYVDRGLVRPIFRTSNSQKGIEPLPVNEDLTTDPMGKTVMAMLGRTGIMGRLYLAPPGTPSNVLTILREGFASVLKDPEIQADSQKARLELEYVPAEECIKVTNYILEQPPEVVKIFGKYASY